MVTREELNNARNKMLEQKKHLEEKRNQQREQNLTYKNNDKKVEIVETYLPVKANKIEKKNRPLLTKTESISILITEVEMIKDLRARITDPKNDFYPSKSDIYRLGISLLESFKDKEVIEMIKSVKL